jgi:hypothetical protein
LHFSFPSSLIPATNKFFTKVEKRDTGMENIKLLPLVFAIYKLLEISTYVKSKDITLGM